MKYSIFFLVIGLFLMINMAEASINVTSGSCLNVTLYNASSNTSYSESICAEPYKFNIEKNLNYSEIFNITEANITIIGPPTLMCPACPGIPEPQLCIDQQEFLPSRNISYYNNYRGVCRLNYTVTNVSFEMSLPPGHMIYPRGDIAELQLIAKKNAECCLNLGNETIKRNYFQEKYEETKVNVCPISDEVLLKGYKKLDYRERSILEDFIKVDYFITSYELADFITSNKNLTDEEFANLYWDSDMALNHFQKIGFAEEKIKQVYYPQIKTYKNETSYMSKINSFCLNRTNDLREIEHIGFSWGTKKTGIIILIIVIAVSSALIISNNLGVLPQI